MAINKTRWGIAHDIEIARDRLPTRSYKRKHKWDESIVHSHMLCPECLTTIVVDSFEEGRALLGCGHSRGQQI